MTEKIIVPQEISDAFERMCKGVYSHGEMDRDSGCLHKIHRWCLDNVKTTEKANEVFGCINFDICRGILTLEIAKELKLGTILYHTVLLNADGSPQRWKVNGKVKTFKRNPKRILVPLKRGIRDYGYLTENTVDDFRLRESDAYEARAELLGWTKG